MNRQFRFLFALCFLSAASAHAQLLPAPAPQPSKITPPPTQAAPSATTKEMPLLEDPLPSESPIVIGEPVRHQTAPTPSDPPSLRKPNASVAGVSIVGLSDGAAVAKLRAAFSTQLKTPVRLIVGEYQYTFLQEELGASIPLWPLMRQARTKNGDVPLRLQVNEETLLKVLRELDGQVRDDFETLGLNVGASKVRVKLALETTPVPASISMVTMPVAKAPEPVTPPEKTDTQTEKAALNGEFPYMLATYSTHYDASLRGRTSNLRMAAKHIDGTVVAPGKIFSTNMAIGPRDAGSGWQEAKMFVSGRVVSGTGAGICQAASTLYNAALLGNLPIVERHPHSMRVMYVPPSRDAALMWGSKDFKFRNTTDGALKVQTWVAGGKFHVKILSQTAPQNPPIQIVSRVISRTGGTRSEAYKVVGGQKIRLSRDSYKPHP